MCAEQFIYNKAQGNSLLQHMASDRDARYYRETISTIRGIFPYLCIKKSQDADFLWVIQDPAAKKRMEIKGESGSSSSGDNNSDCKMQITDGSKRFEVKNVEEIKNTIDSFFAMEAFKNSPQSPTDIINIFLILSSKTHDDILLLCLNTGSCRTNDASSSCSSASLSLVPSCQLDIPLIEGTNWFAFRKFMIFNDFHTTNLNTEVIRLYPNSSDFLVTVTLCFDPFLLMNHIKRHVRDFCGEGAEPIAVKVCNLKAYISQGKVKEPASTILSKHWLK